MFTLYCTNTNILCIRWIKCICIVLYITFTCWTLPRSYNIYLLKYLIFSAFCKFLGNKFHIWLPIYLNEHFPYFIVLNFGCITFFLRRRPHTFGFTWNILFIKKINIVHTFKNFSGYIYIFIFYFSIYMYSRTVYLYLLWIKVHHSRK